MLNSLKMEVEHNQEQAKSDSPRLRNVSSTLLSRSDENSGPLTGGNEGKLPGSSPEKEALDQEYIHGFKLALVLGALTLVYFLVMLDNTILATAIPYITDEFNSLVDIGWYGGAYQLSCAALIPMSGKVYTQLNSKKVFFACIIIFMAGSAVCGAAQSSVMLIIGRAIAGIGGSGLLNGSLIILNSCVPPQRQPVVMGIVMSIGQLGIAFGPLIGGAFTEYVTWRWCFYLNLPIGGVIAATIILTKIPDHLQKPSWRAVMTRKAILNFDIPGFILFAPAAIQFFLALQWGGNTFAWNSRQVIGLFCGAAATFILWLFWDYHHGDNAMIPFSVMRKKVVWVSAICGSFFGGTIFVTAYYLPIYFQSVRGEKPFISGVDILPNILTQMVVGLITGITIPMVGYYPPFMILGAILNTTGCGLLGLLSPSTSKAKWAGFQIIFGAGRGFAASVPFLAVQNNLPKHQIPAAISVLVFLQNFTAATFIVLSQTIFINSLKELLPKYATGVNPTTIIDAGSTSLEKIVDAASLSGVLLAYSKSIDRVFYFCAGVAAPPVLLAWFLGWQRIGGLKPAET